MKDTDRWVKYNPNPHDKIVGDCAVRACCKAMGSTWNTTFRKLSQIAYRQKDVLSANTAWGELLEKNGFTRYNEPLGTAVKDFCITHPIGTYVLGLDGHVVAVQDGFYFDTWDSGDKHIICYWEKKEDGNGDY